MRAVGLYIYIVEELPYSLLVLRDCCAHRSWHTPSLFCAQGALALSLLVFRAIRRQSSRFLPVFAVCPPNYMIKRRSKGAWSWRYVASLRRRSNGT